MRIATFFTEGYYEQVASNYIVPSAQKLGIDLLQIKVPSLHNWKKNTALKADIFRTFFSEYKDDLALIDADATFERYPEMLYNIPSEYDIAYHNFDTDLFWHGRSGGKKHLCSGTLVIRNNPIGRELVETWKNENERNPHVLEQMNLNNLIVSRFKDRLKSYELPIEYLAIVLRDGNIPSYIKEPVIIHHQASRISKRMEL